MAEQIKLTVDKNLADVFKDTAKELGYLSTQEFIVESARKRAIAFRLSGMKSLKGSLNKKRLSDSEEMKLLSEFFDSGSEVFRKFKQKYSDRIIR
ncbi:MAG: hypothetical protein ACOCUR_01965 [Nanoarchaeota archaeon]